MSTTCLKVKADTLPSGSRPKNCRNMALASLSENGGWSNTWVQQHMSQIRKMSSTCESKYESKHDMVVSSFNFSGLKFKKHIFEPPAGVYCFILLILQGSKELKITKICQSFWLTEEFSQPRSRKCVKSILLSLCNYLQNCRCDRTILFMAEIEAPLQISYHTLPIFIHRNARFPPAHWIGVLL